MTNNLCLKMPKKQLEKYYILVIWGLITQAKKLGKDHLKQQKQSIQITGQ